MDPVIIGGTIAGALALAAAVGAYIVVPRRNGGYKHLKKPARGHTGPILFYDRGDPYYEFTNFSPHAIEFEGKIYPSSEHLFQAHKFLGTRPDIAERVRAAPSPRAALEEATRQRAHVRPGWRQVNIASMDTVLALKFAQHADLRQLLLDTGNRVLVEDSPVDSFWGCGADGKGRNELGKALMRLRDKLRQQARLGGRL
ncbi:NADAR family protein [Phanerochaete sordida]|uniref:NADAR family protein n=1 Tax=Phanerochaete sordida TaxID=48140 RepID=A0A9P3GIM0_9APHY|nr:NADAR family protein [Phanerochaete sordida]